VPHIPNCPIFHDGEAPDGPRRHFSLDGALRVLPLTKKFPRSRV
jgi:hypothetical protein